MNCHRSASVAVATGILVLAAICAPTAWAQAQGVSAKPLRAYQYLSWKVDFRRPRTTINNCGAPIFLHLVGRPTKSIVDPLGMSSSAVILNTWKSPQQLL
jgi:hypothetical protein